MISRKVLRFAALMALGTVLFGQVALVLAACDWLSRTPALVLKQAANEASCHEEPARNANLCLADCLGHDQSAGTPLVVVSAWAGTPLVVAVVDPAAAPSVVLEYALPRAGAPPPRILFQSFLI